ncbi:MAG: acetyl-CoA C-acetyltransferase [Arenicella sp.]|jgi:acetyl-CoA C-acetyltransferase
MTDAYIYDAIRTPRTKARPDGGLHDLTPYELLSALYSSLETRTGLNPDDVNDVILGCATQVGEQAGNIAKTSTLYHAWPSSIPGITLNRYCSSGIDAVNFSAMKIMTGMDDLVVAGGIEMLSRTKMMSDNPSPFLDPKMAARMGMYMMGNGADLIASLNGISRQQTDEIAYLSQQRAAYARDNGYYKSIIPINNRVKGITVDKDENIRPNTTLQSLSELEPAFAELGANGINAAMLKNFSELNAINHVHTAANSPAMADGAAVLLIGSKSAGDKLSIKPRARIRAMRNVNDDTRMVISGCVLAAKELMKRENLTAKDIDLFELHEAFAATMVYAQQELTISANKLNVNGGCISLGHPLGATGAMMIGTALDELERRDLNNAIVTASGAAGAGTAIMIERL